MYVSSVEAELGIMSGFGVGGVGVGVLFMIVLGISLGSYFSSWVWIERFIVLFGGRSIVIWVKSFFSRSRKVCCLFLGV